MSNRDVLRAAFAKHLTEKGLIEDPMVDVDEEAAALADLTELTQASLPQTVTCTYCGYAYPSGTPRSRNALLSAHIKVCEKHPMRATEQKLLELQQAVAYFDATITRIDVTKTGRRMDYDLAAYLRMVEKLPSNVRRKMSKYVRKPVDGFDTAAHDCAVAEKILPVKRAKRRG